MHRPSTRALGLCVLLAAIVCGSWVRIHTALSLQVFHRQDPTPMLRSEPALLYYITERIIASGGRPPRDFRSDPRVEWPESSDLPAMFTVGEEFLVAWAYRILGGELPLHVFCVIAMGIVASLAAAGVHGLAREITGSAGWAALAVALYALTPANYRTISAILMREDLSLPLFAIHLWLVARACRVRTPASYALAGLALAAALATWHAMGFIVLIEAGLLLAWCLRSGQNPFDASCSWLFAAVLCGACLLVPVLRAKLFVLSAPMQITAALLIAAAASRRWRSRTGARAAVILGSLGACSAGAWLLGQGMAGGGSDYGHVFDLMWSKIRFLGQLPDDPARIPFGARLLWQGPFATGSVGRLLERLGGLALVLPAGILVSVPGWVRARGDPRSLLLAAFGLASLAGALLVQRLDTLVGLLAPGVAIVALREIRPAQQRTWIPALLLVQACALGSFLQTYPARVRDWYNPARQEALAETISWVRENLPADGAIAADFVSSAALLAQTGHPILLQPKYETRRSRNRIEKFVETFFEAPPATFHRLLSRHLRARYLVVNAPALWAARYWAGIRMRVQQPPPGTSAAAFLVPDPHAHPVPGFRLLHTSPHTPPLWRIYEIEPPR